MRRLDRQAQAGIGNQASAVDRQLGITHLDKEAGAKHVDKKIDI